MWRLTSPDKVKSRLSTRNEGKDLVSDEYDCTSCITLMLLRVSLDWVVLFAVLSRSPSIMQMPSIIPLPKCLGWSVFVVPI